MTFQILAAFTSELEKIATMAPVPNSLSTALRSVVKPAASPITEAAGGDLAKQLSGLLQDPNKYKVVNLGLRK